MRQAQAGAITTVQIVEQVVAAEHTLVDVLGGEIEVVVVVPQRRQRLSRVAVLRLVFTGSDEPRIREAREHVRVVLVLEALRVDRQPGHRIDRASVVDRVEVVDRIAVALRRRMPIVQVGGHLGDAKRLRDLHRRQVVVEPHHDRLTVFRLDQRPGHMPVEAPDSGRRIIRVQLELHFLHGQLIIFLRRHVAGRAGAALAGVRVVCTAILMLDPLGRAVDRGGPVGRPSEHGVRVDRRLQREPRHRCNPRTHRRAGRRPAEGGVGVVQCRGGLAESARAEAGLGDQRAAGREQAQTHHLALAELRLDDLLSIALCGQRQLLFPISHREVLFLMLGRSGMLAPWRSAPSR